MPVLRIAVFLAATIAAQAADPAIGGIDFFGYGGLDVEAVRAALPLKPGDSWPEEGIQQLRDAVRETLGQEATDVAWICCQQDGNAWIFIGLPGSTSRPIAFSAAHREPLSAAPELLRIAAQLGKALQATVLRGEQTGEDRSNGYALQQDPESRALQLRLREYAVAHGPEILAVLANSSNARQRAVAATAAGYMEHSAAQVKALSAAMFDPNSGVRNDATRALLVLAGSGINLAAPIPAAPFIDLLYSGIWTDRNKASGALLGLTQSRDPQVLSAIQERGLAPLVEITHWGSPGHALIAVWMLGRMAGLDDATIDQRAADPAFIDFCLDKLAASTLR